MPFNFVSDLTFASSPIAGLQTPISQLTRPVPDGPVTDIDGGTLEVIGLGAVENDLLVVRYTAADGTQMDTPMQGLVPLDGVEITSTQGCVFDAAAKTFVIPHLILASTLSPPAYPTVPGVFSIKIAEDGTASLSEQIVIEADEFTGETGEGLVYEENFVGPLEVTSLGGGRIALRDTSGQIAIASDSGFGIDGYSELPTFGDNLVLNGPEGGLIVLSKVEPSGDNAFEYSVQQFDADLTIIEDGVVDFTPDLAAIGLYEETTTVHVAPDDNGDLTFSFTQADVTFAAVLDILPETIIEEPDLTELHLTNESDDIFEFGSDLAGVGTIYGKDGVDTIILDTSNPTVFGGKGSDSLYGGSGDSDLRGGDGSDYVDGWSGNNTLYGNNGSDYLTGYEGNDTLFGGQGADYLWSYDGADDLRGGKGDDQLFGGEGADVLNGNTGRDILYGDGGDDTLFGGFGEDYLQGDDGGDRLIGGHADDQMFGGAGADVLLGGQGSDEVFGGNGEDVLRGGKGDDTLDGGNGSDRLYGNGKADILFGRGGTDSLFGGEGFDDLYGGGNDDLLHGGAADDRLFGGQGNDNLSGGSGYDLLSGGAGDDTLSGGDGFDDFDFDASLGVQTDTVIDFDLGEVLSITSAGGALTFEDLFLSQEDSAAVIQAGDLTIRLENTDAEDLDEFSFYFD